MKNKKRFAAIFVGCLCLAAGSMWLIKAKENKIQLFRNVSPETSALALWYYDGTNVERSFLYDVETEHEVIDYFNHLKVKEADEVSLTDLTGPMYGFDIAKKDGMYFSAVWRDGYWLDHEDNIYQVTPDFNQILNQYSWKDKDTMSIITFPNLYRLALSDGTWKKELLSESKKLNSDGLAIQIKEFDGTILNVTLMNQTDAELCYGEYFTIQVQLDGVWYDIPAKEELCFNDIAYLLAGKEENEKTYDISFYGELPEGTYRLVVEGASAEFMIP